MLLVTGITGHSGRYFLQELIRNEYKGNIRCIVRKTSDTVLIDNSELVIEKVIGNLDNKEFVEEAMVGVDVVLHIYNIHHSPMIVEAAIKNKAKRIILVHTTGIYSNFKNASKEYKELEEKVFGLIKGNLNQTSITILRPTMIYGDMCDHNMSKFIKMIDKFPIIPVINKGNSLIQPVNARDLGKAFFNVLMSPNNTSGKNYNISGDKPIKMIDIFKMMSFELGKKNIFVNVSMQLGVFLTRIVKVITLGRIDYIEKVQRMGEDRSYSHDEATIDFDYNPMTFEDGIKIEVQQYLKRNM